MKKAKIMLPSLSLFAIFGAVLAFKEKMSVIHWCSTTRALGINATTSNCPLLIRNRTTDEGTPTIYATLLDEDGNAIVIEDQCTPALNCVKVKLRTD